MPKYGPSGHTIEDEGTAVVQRPTLNFVGAGVAVTDSGGKSTVTIAGGAASEFSGARVVSDETTVTVPGDGSAVSLDFDVEIFDTDAYFSLANPARLTIPETGTYVVGAAFVFSFSGATDVEEAAVEIRRFFDGGLDDEGIGGWNDELLGVASTLGAPGDTITSGPYEFVAGDWVELRFSQLQTVANDASGRGVFWIEKASSGPAGPEGPSGVPVGGIIMWSGEIADIPTDWALCDGTANSPGPDLRDKFIVGATSDDAGVAKTNLTGSLTASGTAAVSAHTLTTNVALSAHTLSTNVAIADHTLGTSQGRTSTASTRAFVTTTGPSHTITQPVVAAHTITQPVVADHTSNWPSYYALAFIQRMA